MRENGMKDYYHRNQEILDQLREHTCVRNIHGVRMEVKDIPDPLEGVVLDPRVYQNRKLEEEKGNPLAECEELPIDLLRKSEGYPNRDITSIPMQKTEQTILTRNGATRIYLYQPAAKQKEEGARAAMVFMHGGAFLAGSPKTVENFCLLLSELSNMVVINVEYRLAPEHKFPIGLYDCYDAVIWTYEHAELLEIDKNRIAVGGDSAGGTLSLGCSLLERDAVATGKIEKSRICYEALLYPAVMIDHFQIDDFKWKVSNYGDIEDDMLTLHAVLELKGLLSQLPPLYMGEEMHVRNPLAAPLFQKTLQGLPKTLMVLCEFDYLRLSSEAFCRKMMREGMECKTLLYRGMDHAFIDKTGDYPQAYDLASEIARDMKRELG